MCASLRRAQCGVESRRGLGGRGRLRARAGGRTRPRAARGSRWQVSAASLAAPISSDNGLLTRLTRTAPSFSHRHRGHGFPDVCVIDASPAKYTLDPRLPLRPPLRTADSPERSLALVAAYVAASRLLEPARQPCARGLSLDKVGRQCNLSSAAPRRRCESPRPAAPCRARLSLSPHRANGHAMHCSDDFSISAGEPSPSTPPSKGGCGSRRACRAFRRLARDERSKQGPSASEETRVSWRGTLSSRVAPRPPQSSVG